MSAGWQIGDLALCVDVAPNPFDGRLCNLVQGCIYRVEMLVRGTSNGKDCIGLMLDGEHSGSLLGSYLTGRFRKIKPDTEGANEDDAAWLKDLLAKPKVKA